MPVSLSPRLDDNLDTDDELEPANTDPRFEWGFGSLTLEAGEYDEHNFHKDDRAFASTPDPGASHKRKRQRESDAAFALVEDFEYKTVADGNAFRLVEVHPGTGSSPIECALSWEDSRHPQRSYYCLSYCWQTVERTSSIFLDGCRFPVTKNLLCALQNLRKPRKSLLIWIDQICIDQHNDQERGHQVSIMRLIFNQAHQVYIWLGEHDDRSKQLFEYAEKKRSGDDSPRRVLNRLLSRKELRDAIERLLERPWFQRVWVLPEVVLSKHTRVVCGRTRISWDNFVRLIRDELPTPSPGFQKRMSLLGNSRQRLAIISQMIASQKEALAHTDITQLLILGKSSKATDPRDMVFAFYGLTYLTTAVNYSRSAEWLFIEVTHMYINALRYEASYDSAHSMTDEQKTFQLMSILYSAGALHQHYELPSWIPDWTYSWHIAPVWASGIPNFIPVLGKDEWTTGIRSEHRAGGDKLETFEILEGSRGQLRISALIFDKILLVDELTPASTPAPSQEIPRPSSAGHDSPEVRYGRHFFTTIKGHVGMATPGIVAGDECAILLAGDVPVILRPCPDPARKSRIYKLLCECYIQAPAVMSGDLLRNNWTSAEDIVLI
ncbi:hypothetical protein CBER1_05932 [Cercospora berteroae]|uniref:Heterokaryon incompatibility domain-containing protein n=1 Tax=Cercospora berteroae TaxID=357750 RepID=A0A2S6BS76_9PEZI|nr:hypothetical protein CBER1_05932 [Cercospora berteroae]